MTSVDKMKHLFFSSFFGCINSFLSIFLSIHLTVLPGTPHYGHHCDRWVENTEKNPETHSAKSLNI